MRQQRRLRRSPLPGWLVGGVFLALAVWGAGAQPSGSEPALPRRQFTSGEETLRAFGPISQALRLSVVKLNVDGQTSALGAVMDTNGLVLSKGSELRKGRLTCWLGTGQEVPAEILGLDEEEDLALVRVHARDLRPLQWSDDAVSLGQWAVTPGIAETPQAVGIVSALPRRIRPPRAYVGIQFDVSTSTPRIEDLMKGLGAAKAGLKAGDVIVALNGTAVTNRQQVIELVREFREGQTVTLRVERTEGQFEAEVQLMALKGEPSRWERGEQRLVGEVSQRSEGFEQAIEHDTVLPPWLCGGPLVNLDGKAIGLNIARAGRVTTYALPTRLVKRAFASLKAKYGDSRRSVVAPSTGF